MASTPQPANYRDWVFFKIEPRQGKNGPLFCRSAVLLTPPKYLAIDPSQARAELTRMRDEGLIACTNGIWWRRGASK